MVILARTNEYSSVFFILLSIIKNSIIGDYKENYTYIHIHVLYVHLSDCVIFLHFYLDHNTTRHIVLLHITYIKYI